MQEHPVPQQISSYQFRLVGDMTLKQFFQVAGGAIVALIFYALPLHNIFKWPLMLGSFGLGAALAFLPLEDRPLDRWIVAFFRSIYSPTLYYWKKNDQPENYFQPETGTTVPETPNTKIQASNKDKILDKLEEAETNFLNKVGTLFAPAAPITNNQSPINTNKPIQPVQFSSQNFSTSVNQILTNNIPNIQPTTPSVAPNIAVPQTGAIKVEAQTAPQPIQPAPEVIQPVRTVIQETQVTAPIVSHTPTPAANLTQAQFSTDAAPPTPPTYANIIVGQVMDPEGKIIESAILEIKDNFGRPVRALKTNKAGHFMIVTPLVNGPYEIITEKDGFLFPDLKFEAKGEIIPPIAVRATARQQNTQEVAA